MDHELIKKKTGGLLNLFTAMHVAIKQLGLSSEQLSAFCSATADGEELWESFLARRDSKETDDGYVFRHFIVEVLASTEHPFTPGENA